MDKISFKDFSKIQICAGTILSAIENNNLKKPSIILKIDFGNIIGVKKSSAQLRENYECADLVGKQIIAVINFPPMQISNLISEVLVLGLPNSKGEPILVSPDKNIKNGLKLY